MTNHKDMIDPRWLAYRENATNGINWMGRRTVVVRWMAIKFGGITGFVACSTARVTGGKINAKV